MFTDPKVNSLGLNSLSFPMNRFSSKHIRGTLQIGSRRTMDDGWWNPLSNPFRWVRDQQEDRLWKWPCQRRATAARGWRLCASLFWCYAPPGKILDGVSHSLLQGSSQPRDWIHVSCITGRLFIIWAIRKVQVFIDVAISLSSLNCLASETVTYSIWLLIIELGMCHRMDTWSYSSFSTYKMVVFRNPR